MNDQQPVNPQIRSATLPVQRQLHFHRVASARNVTEEKCASSLAGLLNKSQ
jgi:hypothetical protein